MLGRLLGQPPPDPLPPPPDPLPPPPEPRQEYMAQVWYKKQSLTKYQIAVIIAPATLLCTKRCLLSILAMPFQS